MADINELEARLATARGKLDDPNLTKERRARINAEIRDLEAAVARARSALDSVQSKTVTITVNTQYGGGRPLATGGVMGAHAYAQGGNTRAALARASSAMALVGEAGPELVRLPYGSTVIPAGQTQRMLAEGDGILRGYAAGGPAGSGSSGGGPGGPPSLWGNPGSSGSAPKEEAPWTWGNPGPAPQIGEALAIDANGNPIPPGYIPPVELSVVRPNDYADAGGGSSGGGGGGFGGWPDTIGQVRDWGWEGTVSTPGPSPSAPISGGPGGAPVPGSGWGWVPIGSGGYAPGGSSGGDGVGLSLDYVGSPTPGGNMASGGRPPGGGGFGTAGVNLTVIVQGSIRSDRDLVQLIRDELMNGGLRGVRS